MLPGPVFNVELLTTARRARYFVIRVLYGLALLFLVWTNYTTLARFGSPEPDRNQLSMFAQGTFYSMIVLQIGAVLAMTPSLVAGVIANEKQRKTLHYLLASRLPSSEIVLGKLMARMLHVAVFLAIALPITSLLSLFGGVDPLQVVLAFAGSLSLAYFLASISILCSTVSKRVRDAIVSAYGIELLWLAVPPILKWGVFPEYTAVGTILGPPNDWIYASTPWAPLGSVGMFMRGSSQILITNVSWMMGLQVAFGSILVAIAVWRLRPIAQAQDGATGIKLFGKRLGEKQSRLRFRKRKPVGENAILWKEMHTSRNSGIGQLIRIFIGLVILIALAYWTFLFGASSWQELSSHEYFASGPARQEFNAFLRSVSTMLAILACLAAAIGGANSLCSEREEDTWISLVSTPLEGVEIILAKFYGVVWKLRYLYALMLGLWIIGAACGAVHPMAILIETIEVASFVGFAAALGMHFSLKSKSTWKSQTTTIAVLVLVSGGYTACLCPIFSMGGPSRGAESILFLLLSGVTPMIEAVSLMTPWEPNDLAINAAVSQETVGLVMACAIGTVGYAIAGFLLMQGTVARFDAAAERPRRGSMVPPWRDAQKPSPKSRNPHPLA